MRNRLTTPRCLPGWMVVVGWGSSPKPSGGRCGLISWVMGAWWIGRWRAQSRGISPTNFHKPRSVASGDISPQNEWAFRSFLVVPDEAISWSTTTRRTRAARRRSPRQNYRMIRVWDLVHSLSGTPRIPSRRGWVWCPKSHPGTQEPSERQG